MKQQNPFTVICGANDFRKFEGFKVVNVQDTCDEDANEAVMVEFVNDFGVRLDMLISGEEVHANQPYIDPKRM